jgi:hypothetical protein
MNTNNHHSKLIFINDPDLIEEEIRFITNNIFPDYDFTSLIEIYRNLMDVFQGEFPGYRESTAYYHDLSHTLSVLLAAARILHGFHLSGKKISETAYTQTLYAALFHDIGYIQYESDLSGTGAKYTDKHVQRGIGIMRVLLEKRNYSQSFIDNCGYIISFTDIHYGSQNTNENIDSDVTPFGQILGAADLVAQVADERYPSKIPELYKEFVEAGIDEYSSEDDLFRKTPIFAKFVRKRLSEKFENIHSYSRLHFKERHGLDEDLYTYFMERNFKIIDDLLKLSKGNYSCNLRPLSS